MIPISGIAYLSGFFALGFLAYRFFQYWQRDKTFLSKVFFYYITLFALAFLIMALGIFGLFFLKNPKIMVIGEIIVTFLYAISCAIGGYLILYLRFPKISPWLGFGKIFVLGLISTILIIQLPFKPIITSDGVYTWEVASSAYLLVLQSLLSIIFLATLLPLFLIFLQQLMISKEPYLRMKTLGMSLAFLFGLLAALTDYFIERVLNLESIISDYALIFLSIVLFVTLLFIQKPPPKEEYVPTPLKHKIQW